METAGGVSVKDEKTKKACENKKRKTKKKSRSLSGLEKFVKKRHSILAAGCEESPEVFFTMYEK